MRQELRRSLKWPLSYRLHGGVYEMCDAGHLLARATKFGLGAFSAAKVE